MTQCHSKVDPSLLISKKMKSSKVNKRENIKQYKKHKKEKNATFSSIHCKEYLLNSSKKSNFLISVLSEIQILELHQITSTKLENFPSSIRLEKISNCWLVYGNNNQKRKFKFYWAKSCLMSDYGGEEKNVEQWKMEKK